MSATRPSRTDQSGPATRRGASRPASPARRVVALAGLELRLLLRSGESLLVTFGVPLGVLLFFGTTEVLPVDGDPLTFLVPGVLAVAILSTGFVAQAIQTGFDRTYGVLKRLGASPLTRPQFVLGKAAATSVVVIVQVAVLLGVALAIGWRPTDVLPSTAPSAVWVVLAVVLGAMVFGALGLALAGAVRAELVLAGSNALYLVMVAGSDLVFDLPPAADPVIALTPSGALGALLRHGLGGDPASGAGIAVVVLVAWGLGAVAVAARTFRWEP